MTALSASWVGNADFPFEISWQLENWVSRLFRNGKKIISDNQDNGGFLPSLSKWKPNIWKFEKLRHLGSLVTKSENGSSLKSTSYKLGRKLFPYRSDKDRPIVTYFISQIKYCLVIISETGWFDSTSVLVSDFPCENQIGVQGVNSWKVFNGSVLLILMWHQSTNQMQLWCYWSVRCSSKRLTSWPPSVVNWRNQYLAGKEPCVQNKNSHVFKRHTKVYLHNATVRIVWFIKIIGNKIQHITFPVDIINKQNSSPANKVSCCTFPKPTDSWHCQKKAPLKG